MRFRVTLASGQWVGTTGDLDLAEWTARQFGARDFVDLTQPGGLRLVMFYAEGAGEPAAGRICEEPGTCSWA